MFLKLINATIKWITKSATKVCILPVALVCRSVSPNFTQKCNKHYFKPDTKLLNVHELQQLLIQW